MVGKTLKKNFMVGKTLQSKKLKRESGQKNQQKIKKNLIFAGVCRGGGTLCRGYTGVIQGFAGVLHLI